MDEKTAVIHAITKGLAYQENGGKPDIDNPSIGKTGELKSIFQFEPATWKADAKEILGDENAPLTPDNETYIVEHEVSKMLDEGYNVKQIASTWNSGDKNAYTGKFSDGSPSVGVNQKYGVKYNVPVYANGVSNYAKQFYENDFSKQIKQQTAPTSSVVQNQPTTPATPIAQTTPNSNGLISLASS